MPDGQNTTSFGFPNQEAQNNFKYWLIDNGISQTSAIVCFCELVLEDQELSKRIISEIQKRKASWVRVGQDPKQKARYLMGRALLSGELKRKSCEKCGAKKTDGHHPDYSKPLEVVWLCRKHHKAAHGR